MISLCKLNLYAGDKVLVLSCMFQVACCDVGGDLGVRMQGLATRSVYSLETFMQQLEDFCCNWPCNLLTEGRLSVIEIKISPDCINYLTKSKKKVILAPAIKKSYPT